MILLEELDTEFGNIKIIRSKLNGNCTYYQEACMHSQINEEGISTCGYVHVMHSVIKQCEAKRVLLIGCAGGTLATMLHHLGYEVTVVDINPHAFILAKKYFQMPEAIECIVGDGWSYLQKTDQHFDAIAVDAFDSNGNIPEIFTSQLFFHAAKEVVGDLGIVVMNVMVSHDLDMSADHLALTMGAAALPAILFDWRGGLDHNVIVAGGMVDHVHITSRCKPRCVRRELVGITRRQARTIICT